MEVWDPRLSCKRDQVKMRDYVDRRVTHQSGLPHLPGVPHLHVNKPYISVWVVLHKLRKLHICDIFCSLHVQCITFNT